MPRVLALLWEQRQDVRLHFPNRTPADVLNYLAWCLTQGVHDRCVPVDLTEPSLAASSICPTRSSAPIPRTMGCR
jgi:hypothetical protein